MAHVPLSGRLVSLRVRGVVLSAAAGLREVSPRPDGRGFLLPAVAVAALLLAGWGVLAAYEAAYRPHPIPGDPAVSFFGPNDINNCILLSCPFYDSRGQKHAHLLAVVLAGVAVLLGPWVARRAGRPGLALHVLGAALLGVFLVNRHLYADRWWAYATGGGLLVLLGLAALRGVGRWAHLAAGAGVVGMLAAVMVPAAVSRLDLSGQSWDTVVSMQEHHFSVVGQGDRLAAGRKLFEEVGPYYGVLMPTLAGIVQRYGLTLEMGDYIRCIQALQVVFLALAAFLYGQFSRGRWLHALVPMVLLAATYHFNQLGLICPNQSPWRTLGFPLALAVLWLGRRLPLGRLAAALGVAAGLALAINFETGVAITVGLAAFLFFRHRPQLLRPPFLAALRAGGLFALGVAAVFTAYLGLYRITLGSLPGLAEFRELAMNARTWQATGICGLPFAYDPLALVMFGHALFVLLRCGVVPGGRCGVRQAFLAAAACMLLVWAAYYAHRPHPWNLGSYYLLYGFLLIDLTRRLAHALRQRSLRLSTLAAGLVLVLVVAPGICRVCKDAWPTYRAGLRVARKGPVRPAAEVVAGVYLAPEHAAQLRERAAYIRSLGQDTTVLLLSADYYLLSKLTGVYPQVPFGDMFIESLTRPLYELRVRQVLQSGANALVFDAPGTHAAAYAPTRMFYEQVRRDLAGVYRRDHVAHGCEVWVRVQ